MRMRFTFQPVIFCLGAFFAVTRSRRRSLSLPSLLRPKRRRKKKVADGTKDRALSVPKEITLTSEQQERFDALKKEQAPKVLALTQKSRAILTDEQKAARKSAVAKAKADGKTGKEATAFVEQTIKLTDDQKKQQGDLKAELRTVRLGIKGQVYDLLTTEQREYYKLPKSKKSRKRHGRRHSSTMNGDRAVFATPSFFDKQRAVA